MVALWAGQDDLDRARSDIGLLMGQVRRSMVPLVAWIGICGLVAVVLVHRMTPEYYATAQLLLEPRVLADDGPELARQFHQMDLDLRQVETQIEIIQTDAILRKVFDGLGLIRSADLDAEKDGMLSRLFRSWHAVWIGDASIDSPSARFERFVDRVRVRRIGLSYVIDITYRSTDLHEAVRVANAIVSAYAAERIARIADPARGVPYLTQRSNEVLGQTGAAAAAMKAGTVALADLPDADMRTLGPAIARPDSRFPRLVPALELAVSLALVTGLLAIMLAAQNDRRIRSADQLSARLGISCLGVLARRRQPARSDPLSWDVLAALSTRGWMTSGVRIAFADLGTGQRSETLGRRLASTLSTVGLVTHFLECRPDPGLCDSPVAPERRSERLPEQAEPAPEALCVVGLPPLPIGWSARDLPRLDVVILIARAGQTTLLELRRSLREVHKAHAAVLGVVLAQA